MKLSFHPLPGILLLAVTAIGQTVSPSASNISVPTISRDFWAFKRPIEPTLPEAKDAGLVRTPIDRFILGKLEEKGLTLSPLADRATLIRRASFDLLGLPPTNEDVEAFVADPAPDAYEKLIDRLLASPRYGERWGRYWLDLARYSDTKGYVYAREEKEFAHAHNYRDWVIQALNADMPYDRFLLLQIAADQLGPADGAKPGDLAAMGFLTVGRRFLGVVPDIIDDRIDVTMRTTQALTVGCARCHDHKFDPIPTADYYSLYGVFAGSTERSVCLDSSPKETAEYLKYAAGLKERTDKLNDAFEKKKEELLERLRDKVGDYLAALPSLAGRPDDNFYTQLGPNDVNPIIVRQWQRYLFERSKRFDPIWTPWTTLSAMGEAEFSAKAPRAIESLLNDAAHPLNRKVAGALAEAKPRTLNDVAQMYGKLLKLIANEWRGTWEQSEDMPLPDADSEALRLVLYGDDSPIIVPHGSLADTEWFFDEASRENFNKLQAEIERWNVRTPGAPPYALILEDRPQQKNPRVFKRGNPNTQGEETTRHFVSAIAGENPPAFAVGSGRLELARAIASKENPLTARVMANRIWMHHFGVGLVNTPSDFGRRGERPSHPELLDWLAVRFMNEGWSIKSMHRLIMCSATYRQQDADNPAAAAIDPENCLLWRANRTRLDFEAMRDSLLAVSGELDNTPGGKPTDIGGNRRTIYTKIDRQFVPGMARVFDFACPDLHIPQRSATTVPQQALFFMNSAFVADRAHALVGRAEIAATSSDVERIERLYRIIYQREPTEAQLNAGLAFIRDIEKQKEITERSPAGVNPWAEYAHVLLMSNEFSFVD